MTELQGHEDRLEISADSGVFVRSRAEGSHGRSRVGGSAVQHPHSAREQGATNRTHGISTQRRANETVAATSAISCPLARSQIAESAVPWSRPCRTGTAGPEPKRSGDPPLAPWFASATHGAPAYPC